jgi:predicted nucleotidyltransferase
MIKIDDTVLSNIVATIVSTVAPESIILFGSHCRGTAVADSDIDLLVIVRESFTKSSSRWKEILRIRHALASIRHPKDILVFSREEVEKWRNSPNHIVSICLREGKVLYER